MGQGYCPIQILHDKLPWHQVDFKSQQQDYIFSRKG
jgi:hypothetical protein